MEDNSSLTPFSPNSVSQLINSLTAIGETFQQRELERFAAEKEAEKRHIEELRAKDQKHLEELQAKEKQKINDVAAVKQAELEKRFQLKNENTELVVSLFKNLETAWRPFVGIATAANGQQLDEPEASGQPEAGLPSVPSIEEQFITSPRNKFSILGVNCTEECDWKGEESQLLGHLKKRHTILEHRCLVKGCLYSFNYDVQLKDHLKAFHKAKFACRQERCKQSFEKYSRLKAHFSKVHQRGMFRCIHFPRCPHMSKNRESAYNHRTKCLFREAAPSETSPVIPGQSTPVLRSTRTFNVSEVVTKQEEGSPGGSKRAKLISTKRW